VLTTTESFVTIKQVFFCNQIFNSGKSHFKSNISPQLFHIKEQKFAQIVISSSDALLYQQQQQKETLDIINGDGLGMITFDKVTLNFGMFGENPIRKVFFAFSLDPTANDSLL
jgi:hypothetical protein